MSSIRRAGRVIEVVVMHRASLLVLVLAGLVACANTPRSFLEDDAAELEPDAGREGGAAPPAAPEKGFAVSDAGEPDAGPPANCAPCKVDGPGTYCGLDVGISPYVTGGPFGGFQSTPGTGAQGTIVITLSKPIKWVAIRILDPDYPSNFIRVFDQDDELRGEVAFDADGKPNHLTDSTKGLGGNGLIRRLELIADPKDYVAYDDLTVIPAGCDPPEVK